jgi:hypothetical protein
MHENIHLFLFFRHILTHDTYFIYYMKWNVFKEKLFEGTLRKFSYIIFLEEFIECQF